MAFADYDAFLLAFQSYIQDAQAGAMGETFVPLAHDRLDRKVRMEAMTVFATRDTVPGTQWVPKPEGYLGMRRLKQGSGTETIGLDYLPFARFDDETSANIEGKPQVYTIAGDRILLGPVPNGEFTLEMTYFKRPEVISPTVPSNAYLTDASDLLLYATLAEASAWREDAEQEAKWEARIIGRLRDIAEDEEMDRYPAGQLAAAVV